MERIFNVLRLITGALVFVFLLHVGVFSIGVIVRIWGGLISNELVVYFFRSGLTVTILMVFFLLITPPDRNEKTNKRT